MKKHQPMYDFRKRGILLLLLPSEKKMQPPLKRQPSFIGKKISDALLNYLLTRVTLDNTNCTTLYGDMLICRFYTSEYGYRIAVFPDLHGFRQLFTHRTIVVPMSNISMKKVCFYIKEEEGLRKLPLRLLRSKSMVGRLTTKTNPHAVWLRPHVEIRPCLQGYYLKPFNVTGIPELAKLLPKEALS